MTIKVIKNSVEESVNTPSSEQTYDSSALEAKLATKIAAFNNEDDVEVVDDTSASAESDISSTEVDDSLADQDVEDKSETEEESKVEDAESSDDEEGDTETELEAVEESESKTDSTPTLPDAYRRSLAAYGWTDQEIDQNLNLLGGKFIEMASDIHSKRNAEVAVWAEAGRKARNVGTTAQPQIQSGIDANGVPQQLQPIDLKKMKEKYGDEEMLDEIITPVNATISALNAVIPQLQQGVQTIHQTQMDAAATRVHEFFDGGKMDPYRKFYGGAEQERSSEQMEKRREVLDSALLIMEGAKSLHREFTLEQALQMAHDGASSKFREQAVRKGIKREVKKRNRGITQKPSTRNAKANAGSTPTSASELERKIGAKMRQVFK